MAKRIPDLVAGSEDTLLKTERGNELIGTVNALAGMTFQPANAATLEVGAQGGAVMKFNMDVLGGGGGGSTPTGDIEAVVRQVLGTAAVLITCDSPGFFTITFAIPPAPPP
jgi:hypothetical protein